MEIHHNYGDLISAVRKGPYEQVKTKYEYEKIQNEWGDITNCNTVTKIAGIL